MSHTFTSVDAPLDAPPCSTIVELIVEDYNKSRGNDTGIPMPPDYCIITFQYASVQGSTGKITPVSGELIEKFDTRTSTVLSQCSIDNEDVCKYVGPPTDK
ncbi:hypothetical protein ACQKWADRAFT_307696 [Trichoderma austrokoningii]